MKNTLLAFSLAVFSSTAWAQQAPQNGGTDYDPTAMFGLTYGLGGPVSLKNLGFTLKVVSSNEEEKWIGALGANWYPWTDKNAFGIDLSAGYNFENGSLTIGYDFLTQKPVLGGGYTDTKDDNGSPRIMER